MIKIIIRNNKTAHLECPKKMRTSFDNLLSFKLAGVEFSQAVRFHGWDGITRLLNRNNEFPIGLVEVIEKYCDKEDLELNIEDNRPLIEIEPALDISKKLAENDLLFRDYQDRVVQLAPITKMGIIRSCTASGKSLMGLGLTAKINKPTIIYCIGLDVLKQFHDLFSKILDEEIGFIGNGVCDIKRINIASVWTIGRALDIKLSDLVDDDEKLDEETFSESNKVKIIDCLRATKVHILDECHISTTTTIRAIHKVINPEYIYGLSGTPFRDDNSDLMITGLLGKVIANIPASELISKKVLAQPYIKFVEVPKQTITGPYATIYKEYITENEDRNKLIIENAVSLQKKGYKILILFKNIKHGNTLAKLLEEHTDRFKVLSGKDTLDKREKVKKEMYDGDIDIILASTIFDIGVSIDCLSALILAGAGKSTLRALQRIGRVIRKFPGKTTVAIVDFFDNVKYLKKHSMARLQTYLSEDGFKLLTLPSIMNHGK